MRKLAWEGLWFALAYVWGYRDGFKNGEAIGSLRGTLSTITTFMARPRVTDLGSPAGTPRNPRNPGRRGWSWRGRK